VSQPTEPQSGIPATSAPRAKYAFLFLSLAVLVLDQWTKWLVEAHLPRGIVEPIVPGLLNLVHVKNTGIAFGLFATGDGRATWLLAALGIVVLGVVLVYLRVTPASDRLLIVALCLVAGGAVGNLLDRIAAGSVTDFIDVYVGSHHWPAFNVADSAISIGIVLMLLDTLRRREPQGEEATEAEADATAAS